MPVNFNWLFVEEDDKIDILRYGILKNVPDSKIKDNNTVINTVNFCIHDRLEDYVFY